ncbi:hypothetical protein H257_19288 [Aphanomyces astaci]|uniref:Uncharacterized protein n=1 Tax=Aphanomyces astaci TaxID=112090 RepID=W4FAE6_APHAT|nr:hypothetical protein H257_19288 [Aphanomyces astaci]ETV63781.1 hypothetical protein H257_19288 [Aphanomyces astaci]|eukprot:XP_009846735.1 hypothetical protein H257_19288 [Aphanomyces astaci]
MGILGAKREAQLKAGIEQWLLKKTDDVPELKQIKNILKTHDTQHHLLPLAFHKRIKPPVSPPRRLLFKAEVVAGKRVPFTKALAVKDRKRMDVIYESDDYEKEKRQTTETKSYSTRPNGSGGIMVWGCFCILGKLDLAFL